MKQLKYIGAITALILSVACVSAQSTTTETNSPSSISIEKSSVNQGLWRFSLNGRGVANITTPATVNDNSTYGSEIEIGHSLKLGLPGEIGIRQDFNYSETTVNSVSVTSVPSGPPCCSVGSPTTINGKSTTSNLQFGTKLFYDWQLFRVGNLAIDAGVNGGAYYGSGQSLDWQTSPEVDVRIFLTKNVNTFGRVEYPFDINTSQFTGGLDYTVGLQFRF